MEEDKIKGGIIDAFDEIEEIDPLGDEDPRVEERGEDNDIEEVMSIGSIWVPEGREDEDIY